MLLLNTVLTIPIYGIIFPAFYCTTDTSFNYSFIQNKTCYDLSHIIAIILSFLSFFIIVSIKMSCLILFYERNPLRNNILACDSNISILVKQGIIIVIVWYYIIDPLLTFKPLFIGSLVLIYGWYLLMMRWKQIGFYNKRYMSFTLCL